MDKPRVYYVASIKDLAKEMLSDDLELNKPIVHINIEDLHAPEEPQPVCIGCGKKPEELQEYIVAVEEEDMTPSEYVRQEEGTYNPNNGHFTCTVCYFNMGCPTLPGTRGWKAP